MLPKLLPRLKNCLWSDCHSYCLSWMLSPCSRCSRHPDLSVPLVDRLFLTEGPVLGIFLSRVFLLVIYMVHFFHFLMQVSIQMSPTQWAFPEYVVCSGPQTRPFCASSWRLLGPAVCLSLFPLTHTSWLQQGRGPVFVYSVSSTI